MATRPRPECGQRTQAAAPATRPWRAASAPPHRRPAGRADAARRGRRQRRAQGDRVGLQHRATIQGLPMDPVEAQPRQVFFFDTPDLALNNAGVVVRARRSQGGRGDTVIKLRPVVPAELPASTPQAGRLQRRGGRPARRLRLLRVVQGPQPRRRRSATRSPARCRSGGCSPRRSAQFYREHAPEGLELDSLVPLGPDVPAQDALRRPRRPRRRCARRSSPRCGSTRTARGSSSSRRSAAPAEAFAVAIEARAYLVGARRRPRRRPADQDEDGARVLRRAAAARPRQVRRRHAEARRPQVGRHPATSRSRPTANGTRPAGPCDCESRCGDSSSRPSSTRSSWS